MVLAAVFMPRYLGGRTPSGRTVKSPIQRAKSVECANNLNQIRQAYRMATGVDEENRPRTLADLRTYGVSESLIKCPVGGEPFQFNGATGQVRCVHPGHENN
jgi:hypothetical protein